MHHVRQLAVPLHARNLGRHKLHQLLAHDGVGEEAGRGNAAGGDFVGEPDERVVADQALAPGLVEVAPGQVVYLAAAFTRPLGETGQFAHRLRREAETEGAVGETHRIDVVEPVQGEGGVLPATEEFLQGLRKICDENDICLVFDEVQTGMGRIGHLFASETYGVESDLSSFAKGLGGGFPVGCMLAKKKFGSAIVVGTHGTTYGGNPLATAVAGTVVKEMLKPGFLENVRKTSAFFMEGLKKLQRDSNKITDIRGKGLLIGIDSTVDTKVFIKAAQANGLMTTQAGDSMRLSPPLIITEKEAQEAEQSFGDVLVNQGKIGEDDLRRIQASVLGIPFVDLKGQKLDFDILALIPEPIARNHNIVAFKRGHGSLEVLGESVKQVSGE